MNQWSNGLNLLALLAENNKCVVSLKYLCMINAITVIRCKVVLSFLKLQPTRRLKCCKKWFKIQDKSQTSPFYTAITISCILLSEMLLSFQSVVINKNV